MGTGGASQSAIAAGVLVTMQPGSASSVTGGPLNVNPQQPPASTQKPQSRQSMIDNNGNNREVNKRQLMQEFTNATQTAKMLNPNQIMSQIQNFNSAN